MLPEVRFHRRRNGVGRKIRRGQLRLRDDLLVSGPTLQDAVCQFRSCSLCILLARWLGSVAGTSATRLTGILIL